jgi:hypothetical protein
MDGVPSHYLRRYARDLDGREAVGWLSRAAEDEVWDHFLQGVRLGHLQQSSAWARAKAIYGWQPIRMVVTLDGKVVGGFQILARRGRVGHIGYAARAPVVVPEDPALVDFTLELLTRTAKDSHLTALLIQPPDFSAIDGAALARHRFLPNYMKDLILATCLLDLSAGMDQIARGIRRSTMVEVRQARRRGITIREGGDADVGTFFRLMSTTCQRRGVTPDPATEEALMELWKAFRTSGSMRLTIAEFEGEAVAGGLFVCFGDRVTFWRKGWSKAHRERHPNQLLLYEGIEWSQRNGYKLFDFCALYVDTAAALLRGEPLSEAQKQTKDFAHLAFGPKPLLLPQGNVYLRNPLARILYRAVGPSKWFNKIRGRMSE